MNHRQSIPLRSPRETLGGYVILPRLIDKVRLHACGQLPPEYVGNLLKPEGTLDGWLLAFTGLEAEALRQAILANETDEAVLAWVQAHAQFHTEEEKRQWVREIEAYRPDPVRIQYRRKVYSDLAAQIDVAALSVFDVIDMDEGRLPIPSRHSRL